MNVSRRNWLAAAGASMLLPRSIQAADLHGSGDPDVWPVVVVGSGLAGLSAAYSAMQNAAGRVLLLDKGPLIGGHSQYSSGSIATVVPHDPKRSGWQDSVEQFIADALAVGGGSGDTAVLTALARDSYSALKWLESTGVFFGPVFTAKSGLHPRCFAMPGNSAGRSYVLAMARCVRDAGATFRLNSQVVGFERIPSGGWIVNVKESADGKTTSRTYVAKSLVIASGGFTADRKRCARIDPHLTAEVHTTADSYGTVWDGATSEILDSAQTVGAAVTDGFGLQLLPFWGGRLLDYDGGDIYVNAAGERFVNESLPWKVIADKMLDLEDRSCWVITDARSHKGAMLGLKLINGIVFKADSIEEMASRMHVPSPILKKTIENYNKSVDKGYDSATGKTIFSQRIEQPPFYFGKESIYVHTTLDGIRTDEHARVLSVKGVPMPGLFVAGEVSGGIFGTDRLGGASMTNCLVMGRRAGKNAAINAIGS